MFEESLMESSAHPAARRGWTTLTAIGLQISALSAMLLFPLLHPEELPAVFRVQQVPPLSSPALPASSQPAQPSSSRSVVSIIEPFREPSAVPNHTYRGTDTAVAPPISALASACHGTCGTAVVPYGLGNGAIPALAPPKPALLVISHLDEGQILSRVQPVYPVIAKATHTEGTVLLHAIIARDGTIEDLRIISGKALLNEAALKAVSQWRFRPYVLNGSPIAVETQIVVNFKLSE